MTKQELKLINRKQKRMRLKKGKLDYLRLRTRVYVVKFLPKMIIGWREHEAVDETGQERRIEQAGEMHAEFE